MVRLAHASAPLLLAIMEKDAGIGGGIGQAVKNVAGGVKNRIGAIGVAGAAARQGVKDKVVGAYLKGSQHLNAAHDKVVGAVKGVNDRVGARIGNFGKSFNESGQKALHGAQVKAGITPTVPAPVSNAIPHAYPGQTATAANPYRAPLPSTPGATAERSAPVQGAIPKAPAQGAPASNVSPPPASTPTSAAVAPAPSVAEGGVAKDVGDAAGGLGADIKKHWGLLKDDLGNGQWKAKIPMLAAGALGAYGLYRGAKGVMNYMGREAETPVYNQGGAIPAYGVNQYGGTRQSDALQRVRLT
jgi:hypothetical protein